jgi:hypothetical protein
MDKKSRYVFYILVTVLIFCGFYSVINFKVLVNDGARWLTHMKAGQFFVDDYVFRYSTNALQIFAKLISYLLGETFSWSFLNYTFGFVYFFHPIIAGILCWFLLEKKDIKDLYLPVATLGLASIASMTFAVNVAVESVSLFWPLYFLSKRETLKYYHLILAPVLLFFLGYSYSMSLVLFGILLYSSFLKRDSSKNHKILLILTSVFLVVALHRYFVFIPAHDKKRGFESIQFLLGLKIAYLFIPALLFGLLIPLLKTFNSIKHLKVMTVIAAFTSIGVTYYISTLHIGNLILSAFFLRVMVIPFAFAFVAGNLFMDKLGSREKLGSNIYHWLILGSLMLPNVYYDIWSSYSYGKGINNLKSKMTQTNGCLEVAKCDADKEYTRYGVLSEFLPHLSVVLSDTKEINSLLYTYTSGYWGGKVFPEIDPCLSATKNYIPVYSNEVGELVIPNWGSPKYKFTFLEEVLRNKVHPYEEKELDKLEGRHIALYDHSPSTKIKLPKIKNYVSFKIWSNKVIDINLKTEEGTITKTIKEGIVNFGLVKGRELELNLKGKDSFTAILSPISTIKQEQR